MTEKTNKNRALTAVVSMAMLTAIAVAADLLLRLPGIGGFLTYEPKDVILVIGAFIFGPVAGVVMSLVVCLVEMVTVSSTGFIGLLMNFIASASFVGVSSLIYCRKKTMRRAFIGLAAGSLVMTAVMLLWNYIITPIYLPVVDRQDVIGMMLPLLLPFNLLKAALDSALALLLYKAVVTALRKAKLVPVRDDATKGSKKKLTAAVVIISAAAAATLLVLLLVFAGKI